MHTEHCSFDGAGYTMERAYGGRIETVGNTLEQHNGLVLGFTDSFWDYTI